MLKHYSQDCEVFKNKVIHLHCLAVLHRLMRIKPHCRWRRLANRNVWVHKVYGYIVRSNYGDKNHENMWRYELVTDVSIMVTKAPYHTFLIWESTNRIPPWSWLKWWNMWQSYHIISWSPFLILCVHNLSAQRISDCVTLWLMCMTVMLWKWKGALKMTMTFRAVWVKTHWVIIVSWH